MVCQLTANVHGYGPCVEDVYYEQAPAEGESEKETKMRADRHRRREEVAPCRAQVARLRAQFGRQLSSSAVQTAWPPRVWFVLFKRSEADKVMYDVQCQPVAAAEAAEVQTPP